MEVVAIVWRDLPGGESELQEDKVTKFRFGSLLSKSLRTGEAILWCLE